MQTKVGNNPIPPLQLHKWERNPGVRPALLGNLRSAKIHFLACCQNFYLFVTMHCGNSISVAENAGFLYALI